MLWKMKKKILVSDTIRSVAVFLVLLMVIQVGLPLQAEGQTNPPTNSGDWTIPTNDVTYLNSSQALIQGNIDVYGTLIVNDSSISLWGSSNYERQFEVFNGGKLVLKNSTILSFTSVCFDMTFNPGSEITIENSRIQQSCLVDLKTANAHITNTWFEKSRLDVNLFENTGSYYEGSSTLYTANLTFEKLTFANSSSDGAAKGELKIQNPNSLIGTPLFFGNTTFIASTNNVLIQNNADSFKSIEFNGLEMYGNYAQTSGILNHAISTSASSTRDVSINNFKLHNLSQHYAVNADGAGSGHNFNMTNGSISGLGNMSTTFVLSSGWGHKLIYIKDYSANLKNVSIVNNLFGYRYISSLSSSNQLLNGGKYCSAIQTSSSKLSLIDSTLDANCHFEFISDAAQVTNYQGIASGACHSLYNYYTQSDPYYELRESGNCNQWQFMAIANWGSSNGWSRNGYDIQIENSTIKNNNHLSHTYTNPTQGNSSETTWCTSHYSHWRCRNAHLSSIGIFASGEMKINNSVIDNNTNVELSRSSYAMSDSYYKSKVFSYEVLSRPSSSEISYINNSYIGQPTCSPQSVGTHSDALNHGQRCSSLYVDGGTVSLLNTTMNTSDQEIYAGEVINSYHLDIRVTDPDGVWTPNASVSVNENGFWSLGSQNTGANGGLVRFAAKYNSKTSAASYTYTPHSISVTMPGYSNSTSINVTNYTSVIVYDPTPDAFPGDITQDWDNDSDGYGDNISGNNPDYFPSDSTQWNDTDGDGYGDNQNGNNPDRLPNDSTQWQDADGDGYGDNQSGNNPDRLPNDATQWQDADGDGYGDNPNGNNADAFTSDSTQWSDLDGDGYGDNASGNNPDAFINDATQWSDTDGDGYGDNQSGNNPDAFPLDMTQWYDGDGDGLGDNQSGNNSDPYLGDSDNDGYSNSVDAFPWNPTQFEDLDNDGLGDNTSGTAADPYPGDTDNDGTSNTLDPFPTDATQDTDADGDGYGDNQSGNNPDPSLDDSDNDGVTNSNDDFPYNPTQSSDSDGDGWGDNQSGHPADAFPNEPSQWLDSDGDGYGDNANGVNGDAFPYDSTQWNDADGDGYGDNPTGTLPDEYPNDPSQWVDADGDGYGDNYTFTIDSTTGLRVQSGDPFPLDSTQWSDLDGDGHGDNASGNLADEYPYDHTQWRDRDSDSFPDNYSYSVNSSTGLRENQIGDAFPDDATQWSDVDGDGYGDNASGNNADVFPTDSTQWADADNDGLGDNPNGNNPDPTPGDTDNDGVPDYLDAFPYEATQWSDTDGDGYGDNWGATTWTSLRSPGLPGMFVQNAVLVDYFPTISAAHLDSDFDGFPDNWGPQDTGNNRAGLILDVCPQIYGNATTAGPGCPDGDGDNVADQDDAFPIDPTQWSDSDGDGYGDNQDGSFPDRFPNDPSQCCDRDGDGYGDNASSNPHDKFPDNPTQWNDSDGDGYGDNPQGTNPDMFPSDSTQWLDADGDGYGDDPNGTNPDPYLDDFDNDGYPDGQDDCPSVYGNSTYDRKGCVDSDADGVSDQVDLWPNDPSRSLDSDGDTVNDPDDAFPDDATQWADADNDGLGDNPNGNNPDPSLDDTDNDGYLNQNDIFPEDPTQWQDLDGDGLGDNPEGSNPDPSPNDSDNDGVINPEDLYPLNPDQHSDSDGDGWGDNSFGLDGDAFPSDPTQCCDTDGDGWGDNPNGTMPDAFPLDSTQWIDLDNDGLGDNPDGSNGDPSPNDTDNDGIKNGEDGWPTDPEKSLDSDGDGIEDGDELFLMTKIPSTSAGSVMLLVLLVSIATAIGGYFFGQRNSGLRKGSELLSNETYDSSDIVEKELGENEL
jgi:hypothetical protein